MNDMHKQYARFRIHTNRSGHLGAVWSLVLILGTLAGGHQNVLASNDCKYITSVVVEDIAYPPDPLTLPTRIRFTVHVTYSRTCYGGCAPANPKVRLVLIDCDGSVMASDTRTFTPPCPPGTGESIVDFTFDLDCGVLPKHYRIDEWEGCATEGTPCADNSTWHTGSPVEIPAPEFVCPQNPDDLATFVNDLVCFTCSASAIISDSDFKFYKPNETLYTLPSNDQSGSVWGEAVNGEFTAPDDGLLIVAAEGTSEVADFWGSAVANGDGWQTPAGRDGVRVNPARCLNLSEGERFKFNLRAGRGDDPPDLKITFDWCWWDWGNCCLQRDQRVLDVKVMALPCLFDASEPVMPQRRDFTRSDGSKDTELRLRCCGGGSAPGNLSDWFVAWPTENGQKITHGHAKDWMIDGDALISPGPDSERFEFSP